MIIDIPLKSPRNSLTFCEETEGNDKLEAERQAREIIAKCNIRQLIENTR